MSTRITVGLLFLALAAGCEARLMLGAPCRYASECPAGLVCAVGSCREECVNYRDCDIGSTCLLDAVSGLRGCRVPSEAVCAAMTDCGAGLVCSDGRCVQACVATSECSGLVCTDLPTAGRACIEPRGPACATGADCDWGVCSEGRCDAVRAIVAGAHNTCVLLESGEIECTGDNGRSQISGGTGLRFESTFGRLVDAVGAAPPVEAVAVGGNHLCALVGGEVRCWGAGAFGQTGGPTSDTAPFPDPIVALDGVLQLSLGLDLSCARTATEVLCWGSDRFGLLGDTAVHMSPPGVDPSRGRAAPIQLAVTTRDIDAGQFHACAAALDGDLYCWGANDHGNLGVPDTGERCTSVVVPGSVPVSCSTTPVLVSIVSGGVAIRVDRVTVGQRHTCVLDHEGAVYCWGGNDLGQVGDGTPVGPDIAEPRFVLEGAVDIEAGTTHTCALLENGRVACWGADSFTQLGDGGGGPRTTPVYASGITDAEAIAIGDAHGCALGREGAVWCWGSDFEGQLGDGSTEPFGTGRTPTFVPARTRTGR